MPGGDVLVTLAIVAGGWIGISMTLAASLRGGLHSDRSATTGVGGPSSTRGRQVLQDNYRHAPYANRAGWINPRAEWSGRDTSELASRPVSTKPAVR
jgi:hypothetical protein